MSSSFTRGVIEASVRGHRVLLKPLKHNEIVALGLFSPHGAAADPVGLAGLGNLTQSVMQKGAGERDYQELAEAIEELGSHVSAATAHDFTKFSLAASSRCFFPTLDLLEDMLHRPTFEEEELEKERKLQLADLKLADDNQYHYTHRHLMALLYGDHPYAVSTDGTPESVAAIAHRDILNCHHQHLQTQGAVVAVVGNFEPDAVLKRIESFLPDLQVPAKALPAPRVQAPTQAEWANVLELRKECEQAFLCCGWLTVPFDHPDYLPLRLLSAVLGEGMGSRMFMRLRDEQGLAYATGCSLAGHRSMSHLVMYIGTKPERVHESIAGFQQIIREACQVPPTEEELERARNFVLGHFLFDHQKNSRQAHFLGSFEVLGLGWQADFTYSEQLRSVTGQRVFEAAQRYLTAPTLVKLLPN